MSWYFISLRSTPVTIETIEPMIQLGATIQNPQVENGMTNAAKTCDITDDQLIQRGRPVLIE
jgi:hypothetical protein